MLPDEFCKTRLNNAQFVTVNVCYSFFTSLLAIDSRYLKSITSRLHLSSTFCTAEINEGYPASENGKLAAFASGHPAFRQHAEHAGSSNTTPRLAHTERP